MISENRKSQIQKYQLRNMWLYTVQNNSKHQNQKKPLQQTAISQLRSKQKKKSPKIIQKIKNYYIGKKTKTEENPYQFTLTFSEQKKKKQIRKSAFKQLVIKSALNQMQLKKKDDGNYIQMSKRVVEIKGVNPQTKKVNNIKKNKLTNETNWSSIYNSMNHSSIKNHFLTCDQQNENRLNQRQIQNETKENYEKIKKNKSRFFNKTEGNENMKDIFANSFIKNLNLWQKVQQQNYKSEEKQQIAKKKIKVRKTAEKDKEKTSNKKNKTVYTTQLKLNSMNDLQIIKVIGQGTFGKVYRSLIKSNRQEVAVKVIFNDKTYKTRQVEILQNIKSSFIIKMYANFKTNQHKNGVKKQYNNIVFDYYPFNFYEYMKNRKYKLQSLEIKLYLYQLFRGLLYLHSHDICHRDIKPQNLLIKNGKLVICDLGSAKILKNKQKNISYICSRCYRAPQLIFGSTYYTSSIDIWSAGCIILQILNKTPLFIARNSIQHLVQIIKALGTPTQEDIYAMNPNFNIEEFDVPEIKKKNWSDIFPTTQPSLLDLLNKIMVFNPQKRLNAVQVLSHSYFAEIRDKFIYSHIEKKLNTTDFFNFDEKQFSMILDKGIRKLIPPWYENN